MYLKKPAELKLIAEGGQIMGEILDQLVTLVKPGVSAWDIDAEAERLIRAAGGIPAFKGYHAHKSDPAFPSTICFSRNEEIVHGIATKEKIIHSGDIISLDIGMQYPAPVGTKKGFFTDTALTIPVGEVSEEIKKLLVVTQQSMEMGIAAAQPGKTVADIGRVIEQYVHSQGKYGIVRDLVGHGVGHEVHEEPRVPNFYDAKLETWILQPGVVIAIEPMITLGTHKITVGPDQWTILSADRKWSAHFEHTIIITKDGPQVVTRRPSEK